MPGFDRTGPEGQGSRTGRAMGKCNPKNQEQGDEITGAENQKEYGYGRGQGRGQGRGRHL